MNISQVKEQLGVKELGFVKSKNDDWLNCWSEGLGDNKNVVSIPVDLFAELQKNPKMDTLAIQEGVLETSNGDVKSYRIINPTPQEIVGTL